ncbi:unnamed protein product [Calypogeia fissa]
MIVNSDGTTPAAVEPKKRCSMKQTNSTIEEPTTLPKQGRKPRQVPTDNSGLGLPSIAEEVVGVDLNGLPPPTDTKVQTENFIASANFTAASTSVDNWDANVHVPHNLAENATSMQNARSNFVNNQVHNRASGWLGMDDKVLMDLA